MKAGALSGLDTEYGFLVEGRGASFLAEDAKAFVRAHPNPAFVGWDYRLESPRADIRGFEVDSLQRDPLDAEFDRQGQPAGFDPESRSDRILLNGARLYNDHAHPEYCTPECLSLHELMLHDLAGDQHVLAAARAFEEQCGRAVQVHKNSTDYHGASYGAHESYAVPRSWGFERVFRAVTPILVARPYLVGSGSAEGSSFEMSQRARFFSETASVDTLHRRPVFNTRDEPHARQGDWLRLHVISGDANRNAHSTRRRVGLVRLALALEELDACPAWQISEPAKAIQAVSRGIESEGRTELEKSWTTASHILRSYLEAGLSVELEPELADLCAECLMLMEDRHRFDRAVEWAAKLAMFRQFEEAEGGLTDVMRRSLELQYHLIDPQESLFDALVAMDLMEAQPAPKEVMVRMDAVIEPTRAKARSAAVSQIAAEIKTLSWGRISFTNQDVALPLDACYAGDWQGVESGKDFAQRVAAAEPW